MVVDGKVVVETKATERLADIADRQLRSYLTATRIDVGLILHFGPEAKAHRVKPGRRAVLSNQNSLNADPLDPVDPQDHE
jgi:hypothetical protein